VTKAKPALRGPLRQFIPARNFHIGSSVPPRAALRIVKEFERLPSRVATFGTAVSVQDGVSKCPPLKRRILVDVRGPEEAQKDGELPYTNRIECGPEDDVEAAITRGVEAVILVNDPEREIVVYCKSGKSFICRSSSICHSSIRRPCLLISLLCAGVPEDLHRHSWKRATMTLSSSRTRN